MFSNRNKTGGQSGGSGMFSSRLKRKSKAEGDAPGSDEPAPGTAGSIKPALGRQGSWVAGGMPAPPSGVVAQVQAKKVQVAKESKSAVKIQANIRSKNAKTQVAVKKQAKAENNAATRIQAIKRGQKARAEVKGQKGEEYEEAPNALQKCAAGMAEWFESMMAKCPCTSKNKKLDENAGLSHLMPKHGETKLSKNLEAKLRSLFSKMDKDQDQILSKAEVRAAAASPHAPPPPHPRSHASPRPSHRARRGRTSTPSPALTHDDQHATPRCRAAQAVEFWGKNFAKINAQAMFNEVDADHGDTISVQEWIEFWQNVVGQDCYSEEDVMEELDSMMKVRRPRRPRRNPRRHRRRPRGPRCPSRLSRVMHRPSRPVSNRSADPPCAAHVVRRAAAGSTGMTVAPRDTAEARRHRMIGALSHIHRYSTAPTSTFGTPHTRAATVRSGRTRQREPTIASHTVSTTHAAPRQLLFPSNV